MKKENFIKFPIVRYSLILFVTSRILEFVLFYNEFEIIHATNEGSFLVIVNCFSFFSSQFLLIWFASVTPFKRDEVTVKPALVFNYATRFKISILLSLALFLVRNLIVLELIPGSCRTIIELLQAIFVMSLAID